MAVERGFAGPVGKLESEIEKFTSPLGGEWVVGAQTPNSQSGLVGVSSQPCLPLTTDAGGLDGD